MKRFLLVLLAAALAGCASSRLPMTYEGKPRVPINKPAATTVPLADTPTKKGV